MVEIGLIRLSIFPQIGVRELLKACAWQKYIVQYDIVTLKKLSTKLHNTHDTQLNYTDAESKVKLSFLS